MFVTAYNTFCKFKICTMSVTVITNICDSFHKLINFKEMISNKFEVTQESKVKPKMIKVEHPPIPCCGHRCEKGYVQLYTQPDVDISLGTCFLRCSNSQHGCNQKMYLAYGSTTCMDCKMVIKKVTNFTIIIFQFQFIVYFLFRETSLPKTLSDVTFTAVASSGLGPCMMPLVFVFVVTNQF